MSAVRHFTKPGWTVLVVCLAACLPSCGGDGPRPQPSTVIRLIDVLEADGLQRPFDPTESAGIIAAAPLVLSLSADTLADDDSVWADAQALAPLFPGLTTSAGHHALSGPANERRLVITGPLLLTRVLTVTDTGPLLVRIKANGRSGLGLIPIRRNQPDIDLSDVPNLLKLAQTQGLGFDVVTGARNPWAQVIVPADAQREGLLLTVTTFDATAEVGQVEVRSVSPLTADLLDRGLRPTKQHISLDGEAREAFVLPHGGSARWTLQLPDRPTRLTVDLASLGDPGAAALTYLLQDEQDTLLEGRLPLPTALSADARPWHSAVLELPGHGAGTSTLTLQADAKRGAVALGRPTICPSGTDEKRGPPDVIIVSLDTLRADRLTPGTEATPHLQELTRASLNFTDASSTSAWTLPSHTSLFTGRWPQAHGVTDSQHKLADGEMTTLARVFRDAGYETTAITGGGYVSPSYGLAAGFERYDVNDPARFGIDPKTKATIQPHGSRQSLMELLSGPRTRPLFAFVHTFAAHHGLPAIARLKNIGMDNDDFRAMRSDLTGLLAAQRAGDADDVIDPKLIANVIGVYDASVMSADELVGELVATLIAAGRFDDTILVVTSDHGQELFDRGTVGHGHQMHPELLRIPLLIRAPGARVGAESAPVSLVDIGPTVRELAGLPADADGHGRSLVPLLKSETLRPRPILSHLGNSNKPDTHVFRLGQLTLHLTEDDEGQPQPTALFDLAADPLEHHDLLEQRRALADEMTAEFVLALPLLKSQAGSGADSVALDDDTRRQLEELGYVTGK